ncbi:hypothetical protein [Bacillus cihuensis]|uniref:hypothetical protein n=1 Tax=Bacillus cihuensis TaxID=1208599 RepID=UPI001F43B43A|nr:hypothetical protein [Bacillus cihuensis]
MAFPLLRDALLRSVVLLRLVVPLPLEALEVLAPSVVLSPYVALLRLDILSQRAALS